MNHKATYLQLLVTLSRALRKETISSAWKVHFTYISITLDISQSKNLPPPEKYDSAKSQLSLGWKRSNYFLTFLILSKKIYRGMKMDQFPIIGRID